jgi:glycine oxidase
VRQQDAIVIGGGIIGLSLAIELNKHGLRVLILDKGEPGREASWAAGGMLADFPLEMPAALRELATASARMYPEFVHELEDEARQKIDLRSEGTLLFVRPETGEKVDVEEYPLPAPLADLEPTLSGDAVCDLTALFLPERSVEPRHLTAAAVGAARHRGIEFSSGDKALAVEISGGKTAGVRTSKTRFAAGIVVNCAGAWAGQIACESGAQGVEQRSTAVPTRPVKGQMLCVIMPKKEFVRHVIRTPEAYLIPRSDGRLVIGATQEEAGFDKQTVPATIQKLHRAAMHVVPQLAGALIHEAWAGLRPGTPDALPILGATETPGYFVATGHFRDGILLAPVTARVMGQVIAGERPAFDLIAFRAERFLRG